MGPPVKSEDSENRDAAHCGTALNRSNYDNNDHNIAENIGAARTASKANIEETLGAVRTVSKANKEETLWIALVASQTPSTAKEAETVGATSVMHHLHSRDSMSLRKNNAKISRKTWKSCKNRIFREKYRILKTKAKIKHLLK